MKKKLVNKKIKFFFKKNNFIFLFILKRNRDKMSDIVIGPDDFSEALKIEGKKQKTGHGDDDYVSRSSDSDYSESDSDSDLAPKKSVVNKIGMRRVKYTPPNVAPLPDSTTPEQYAEALMRNGIIVFRLFSDEETEELRVEFDEWLENNPLIKPEMRKKFVEKPAMSNFGALGDSWTMHMPVQRKVNAAYAVWVRKNLANFGGKSMLFVNRDRAMVRAPGSGPSAEATHRDEPPKTAIARNDITLGGWVSLYGVNAFLCAPGTHSVKQTGGSGFNKLSAEEAEHYRTQMNRFVVPPGYQIAFFQNIVHEVNSSAIVRRTARIFQGITFTDHPEPWFTDEDAVLSNFAVHRLPSGQTPYIYEHNHVGLHALRLVEYSKMFIDVFPRKQVNYNAATSEEKKKKVKKYIKVTIVEQVSPSLRDLNADRLMPYYTAEERAILFPQPF